MSFTGLPTMKNKWIVATMMLVFLLVGCQKKEQSPKDESRVEHAAAGEEVLDISPEMGDAWSHSKPVKDYQPMKIGEVTTADPYSGSGLPLHQQLIPDELLRNHSSFEKPESLYASLKAGREERARKNPYKLSFQKVYGEEKTPPPINFDIDLSGRTLEELILLRNEVFAQKGYLFSNAVIRGYFNQFDWYQPVFWGEDHQITLSEEEKQYVTRIRAAEKKQLESNIIPNSYHRFADSIMVGNIENVTNRAQFRTLPEALMKRLRLRNFAVVWSKHYSLHGLYDKNKYEAIPSYITTDLMLRLLNVHYKYLLMSVEQEELIPRYKELLYGLYSRMLALYLNLEVEGDLKAALEYNLIYIGVAGNLLDDNTCTIPEELRSVYSNIYQQAFQANGSGLPYLGVDWYDFTQLKPRGSYTARPTLERYFRCVKWLNTVPLFVDRDRSLLAATLLAWALETDPALAEKYNRVEESTHVFAGEPDDLSLDNVRNLLREFAAGKSPEELGQDGVLTPLYNSILELDKPRIQVRAATLPMERELNRPRLLFSPSRYSFDGEIVQRLMNRARPFPMGLDIFAVLQGGEAERTLMEGYRVPKKWPAYPDSIKQIRKDVVPNIKWHNTLYNTRMDAICSLNEVDPSWPGFMKTALWARRNINTQLAGWTQLKHELILYAKQPNYAESGEGGYQPPPIVPGYVEPNRLFWKKTMDLLDVSYAYLNKHVQLTDKQVDHFVRISEIADFCYRISEKELAGQYVNDEEMDVIQNLGAMVEHLTMDIVPRDVKNEGLQVVVDVASRTGGQDDSVLEEAIGYVDELYVIAEINGRLYITRGGVMSQYEFKQPLNKRLTDEAWRTMLRSSSAPERPKWTWQNRCESEGLRSKPSYGSLSLR